MDSAGFTNRKSVAVCFTICTGDAMLTALMRKSIKLNISVFQLRGRVLLYRGVDHKGHTIVWLVQSGGGFPIYRDALLLLPSNKQLMFTSIGGLLVSC